MSKQKLTFIKDVFEVTKNTFNYYLDIIKNRLIKNTKLRLLISKRESELLKVKILKLESPQNKDIVLSSEKSLFEEYNPNLIPHQNKWVICLKDLLDTNSKYNGEMNYLNKFLDNYEAITNRLMNFTGSKKYSNDIAVIKKLKKVLNDNKYIKERRDYYTLSIISAYNYLTTNKGKLFFVKLINEYLKKIKEISKEKEPRIENIINIEGLYLKKEYAFSRPNYSKVFKDLTKELKYTK